MGKVHNTMNVIQKARKSINSKFDLTMNNMNDIKNSSANAFDLVRNSFLFGYMQGMKAARAEKGRTA